MQTGSDLTYFSDWISSKTSEDWQIYIKRLSANDTGLTGGHQVGIYIPKEVVKRVMPSVTDKSNKNPECFLRAQVSSHSFPEQNLRCVYYNNKHFEGTRDEHRITQWNTGVSGNPVQDPENTGALVFFAFRMAGESYNSDFIDIWVCKTLEEEEYIENKIGEIIPGNWTLTKGDVVFGGLAQTIATQESNVNVPDGWIHTFPTGLEIISHLTQFFKLKKTTPDDLIIERRELEYRLFRQVEELHVLSSVQAGFNSVDDFMLLANSVSNRRKSRSGNSLEIHLEILFKQFDLQNFSKQCITEGKKKPDFIFPSCAQYHDLNFPAENLRMLAVKTTCKDRWRQVLNEANRIDQIHLFTLQEGVSPNQLQEMTDENVKLVVPLPLHAKYPTEVRKQLITLGEFIEQTNTIHKN